MLNKFQNSNPESGVSLIITFFIFIIDISLNKVFQYFMMESGAMKPKVGAQGSLASQYEVDQ